MLCYVMYVCICIIVYTLVANSAIFTDHSQSCLVPQAEAMHDVPKEKPKKATAPWPSDGGIFVRCDVTSPINIGFFMLGVIWIFYGLTCFIN